MTKWFLIILVLVLFGCAPQQKPIDITPVAGDIIEKVRTVYKTNWLAMPFVVGVALGVALFIKGKIWDGLAVAGGSGAGLWALGSYQAFATHRYAPWISAVAVVVLGFGLLAWRFFIEGRAFKEVVAGGEWFKRTDTGKSKPNGISVSGTFNDIQSLSQSIPTKKLVKQAKKRLEKRNG